MSHSEQTYNCLCARCALLVELKTIIQTFGVQFIFSCLFEKRCKTKKQNLRHEINKESDNDLTQIPKTLSILNVCIQKSNEKTTRRQNKSKHFQPKSVLNFPTILFNIRYIIVLEKSNFFGVVTREYSRETEYTNCVHSIISLNDVCNCVMRLRFYFGCHWKKLNTKQKSWNWIVICFYFSFLFFIIFSWIELSMTAYIIDLLFHALIRNKLYVLASSLNSSVQVFFNQDQ